MLTFDRHTFVHTWYPVPPSKGTGYPDFAYCYVWKYCYVRQPCYHGPAWLLTRACGFSFRQAAQILKAQLDNEQKKHILEASKVKSCWLKTKYAATDGTQGRFRPIVYAGSMIFIVSTIAHSGGGVRTVASSYIILLRWPLIRNS